MRFLLPFLLLLSGWAGAAPESDSGARPLRVFVSVLPQKTFVERIGGERVQVEVMVRPGDSPHTYEPTPRQVAALADADLYVAVGGTFEDAWMGRIRSTNPRMAIVNTGEGLNLRAMQAHDHDGGEEAAPEGGRHQSKDPHLWTSPPLVRQMAARIRDALTELDPAQGPFYAANYASFAAELDDLDRDIRAQLAGLTRSSFHGLSSLMGLLRRHLWTDPGPNRARGQGAGSQGPGGPDRAGQAGAGQGDLRPTPVLPEGRGPDRRRHRRAGRGHGPLGRGL